MKHVNMKIQFLVGERMVSSLDELGHDDHKSIINKLISWRREVATQILNEHLENNYPNESVEWEWLRSPK